MGKDWQQVVARALDNSKDANYPKDLYIAMIVIQIIGIIAFCVFIALLIMI